MRNWIIYTLALFFLVSCSKDKKKAVEHYLKAKELYKKEDIKNASTEIDYAIKLDSSNLDFQITKAEILAETNNYDQALEILKILLSKKFKTDTINFYLGNTYFKYGRFFSDQKEDDSQEVNNNYKQAIIYYNKAINTNNTYFEAYAGKQKALHNLNRYKDALVVLNTALNFFPDSISLILNRGIEKLYLRDLNGSLIDLNKSIQSKKLNSLNFSLGYRFRGNLNYEKGNIDSAIIDYTTALKLNPKSEFTLLTRGECYELKGLKDKACEDYRKAADLGLVSLYDKIEKYCND